MGVDVEEAWESPEYAAFLRRLGSFARVSSTVKALVAGSGIDFEDRGPTYLKGIDEAWQLFRLVQS